MDRIPPEIHDHILSFVSFPADDDTSFRLSHFSTLSRNWQRAIERQTFRTLSVTNNDLGDLGDIVVGWRRLYLRQLHVTVNFPDYDHELSREYESIDERAANNALATSSLKQLFAVLSMWGTSKDSKLQLQLAFTSPGDKVNQETGVWRGMGPERYQYSFVTLDGIDECAEAPCVAEFLVYLGGHTRPMELQSYYDLMSRLPGAKRAIWDTVEPGFFTLLRREIHDRFILATESGSHHMPPELHVTIEEPYYEHSQSLPNLTTPYTYDKFSSAFRRLSLGLTEFIFTGIADHTLLWPSPGQALEPHWANLVRLELYLSLQSPSGKWYFRNKDSVLGDVPLPPQVPTYRPPGYYGDEGEEWDQMNEAIDYDDSCRNHLDSNSPGGDSSDIQYVGERDQPNDELMVPLLSAFARAISAMPSLQFGKLEFPDRGEDMTFFLNYAPPGRSTGYGKYWENEEGRPSATAPRLLAHTWDWRMDEDLEGMFRRAGATIHGVETAVIYIIEPDL